jgi:hypothetical protein
MDNYQLSIINYPFIKTAYHPNEKINCNPVYNTVPDLSVGTVHT